MSSNNNRPLPSGPRYTARDVAKLARSISTMRTGDGSVSNSTLGISLWNASEGSSSTAPQQGVDKAEEVATTPSGSLSQNWEQDWPDLAMGAAIPRNQKNRPSNTPSNHIQSQTCIRHRVQAHAWTRRGPYNGDAQAQLNAHQQIEGRSRNWRGSHGRGTQVRRSLHGSRGRGRGGAFGSFHRLAPNQTTTFQPIPPNLKETQNQNSITSSTSGNSENRAGPNNYGHPIHVIHALPPVIFMKFSELPAEIRSKIYRMAAMEPRLLEIVRTRNHSEALLSEASRSIPPILLATFESREETIGFFERRFFNINTNDDTERGIYFNPAADILYFAADKKTKRPACLNTIWGVSKKMIRKDVPRVAIEMTGRITTCCNLDDDGAGWAINGGATLMQTLHGVHPSLCSGLNNFPGFQGLTEISFVVPSNLWPVPGGQVTPQHCFRPAVHDGLTKGQQRFKNRILQDQATIAANGAPDGVGEDHKWSGDKMPTIKFVSMGKKADGGKFLVWDAMALTKSDMNHILENGWSFINGISNRTHCRIHIPKADGGEHQREIGFQGNYDDVKEAKEEILNKLQSNGRRYQAIANMR